MKFLRDFEERSAVTGQHSLLKDAIKYARELDIELTLSELKPTGQPANCEEASGRQMCVWAQQQQLRQEITNEKWHEKFLKNRWEDNQ